MASAVLQLKGEIYKESNNDATKKFSFHCISQDFV
jgi:hypothetical protein